MEEAVIIEELIKALNTNQDLLDSKRKIKVGNLRELISDLNYSFLEILRNIKHSQDSVLDRVKTKGRNNINLYA